MVELTMTDEELKQFIFTNYNERYVARPKLIDEELWARYKVSYIWKKHIGHIMIEILQKMY